MLIWGNKRQNNTVDLSPKPRGKKGFFPYLILRAGNILLFLLVILTLILANHYYRAYAQLQESVTPGVLSLSEQAAITEELSEIMVLPAGETPLIATISNPLLLLGQPFYRNAQKGDKVFVYCVARKSILYNPLSKKIVEFANDVPPKTCPE